MSKLRRVGPWEVWPTARRSVARRTYATVVSPDPEDQFRDHHHTRTSSTPTREQYGQLDHYARSRPTCADQGRQGIRPNVGGTINYTVMAGTTVPPARPASSCQDLLPAGVAFVSATPSRGTYNSGHGNLDDRDARPSARPRRSSIQARVTSPNPSTNTATISHADQFDPDSSQQRAPASS